LFDKCTKLFKPNEKIIVRNSLYSADSHLIVASLCKSRIKLFGQLENKKH